MLEKKDYVLAATVTYVVLVMLYFIVQDKYSIDAPCSWKNPCLRFCCLNSSLCKETFIRESFNQSLVTEYMTDENDRNETAEYLILYGRPKCSLIRITENDPTQKWSVYYVRN